MVSRVDILEYKKPTSLIYIQILLLCNFQLTFKTAKHRFGLHRFGQQILLGMYRWLILFLLLKFLNFFHRRLPLLGMPFFLTTLRPTFLPMTTETSIMQSALHLFGISLAWFSSLHTPSI
jgi:hypothetical protein